ncbi:MAG: hypothetical protein Q8O64_04475, partial [Sideroxyarcus sp.]|nr:hypothetical protein [Sideroxyarcus sp.]
GTRGIASFTLMWGRNKKKSQRIRALVFHSLCVHVWQHLACEKYFSPVAASRQPVCNHQQSLCANLLLITILLLPLNSA